jgi:hypothetical protein
MNWAALSIPTPSRIVFPNQDAAILREFPTVLNLDLVVRWNPEEPAKLLAAQVYIPLDSQGNPSTDRSSWAAEPFGDIREIERLRSLLPWLLQPIVVSLAEENGALPADVVPQPPAIRGPSFPIRAAIESGQFTLPGVSPEDQDEASRTALDTYALLVAEAPPFDASAEAREFLLLQQYPNINPNIDWRSFPSLIPPFPTIYVEAMPPDRVLLEDGRIIPFRSLMNAGVGWSAQVSYNPGTLNIGHFIFIRLNVLDAIDRPPRCDVASMIIGLDARGRATNTFPEGSMVHTGRKIDVMNLFMWLHPLVMRLAAFNS